MLRYPALIPLSHQHQHALALCVFIQRALENGAPEEVLAHWEGEVARVFRDEICYHFDAEEKHLFPAAEQFEDLRSLTSELRAQHTELRAHAAAAEQHSMGVAGLGAFARLLSAHVRKEERELFEGMQRLLSAHEIAGLGAAVDQYFRASGMPPQSCGLPFSTI